MFVKRENGATVMVANRLFIEPLDGRDVLVVLETENPGHPEHVATTILLPNEARLLARNLLEIVGEFE